MRNAALFVVLLAGIPAACKRHPIDGAPPTDCAGCHMPEFQSVTHPLHPGAKPTTCVVCHTQDRWRPSLLRHEWPLTGAHAKADCFACHRGTPPVFDGTGRAGVDCHRADAEKPAFAAHASFGTACEHCHTTSAWKPATGPSPAPLQPEPQEAPSASEATGDAPAPPSSPSARPRPKPGPSRPKPAPSATPTRPPDVVTHPSPRR
jgi:hypothetical protein